MGDSSLLVVVCVRLHALRVAPNLSGRRLRLRVKYGRPGSSVACEMQGWPTSASFERSGWSKQVDEDDEETCIFLAHQQYDGLLRLRSVWDGCFRTTAKAELRLPPVWGRVDRQDLDLMAKGLMGRKRLVRLDVSVSTWAMTKGGLRDCLVRARAVACDDAMLLSQGLCALGEVGEKRGEEPALAAIPH